VLGPVIGLGVWDVGCEGGSSSCTEGDAVGGIGAVSPMESKVLMDVEIDLNIVMSYKPWNMEVEVR
jgi:hypothetical protein